MRWIAAPLPGQPIDNVAGDDVLVLRLPSERRGTLPVLWRGRPGNAAGVGDGVLLDAGDVVGTARARDEDLEVWWRCTSAQDIDDAIQHHVRVWIAGVEAGGETGRVGAIVLLRALFRHQRRPGWVVEGLGPAGRAATRALGAAGCVLQTELWAGAGSPLHLTWRERLRRANARTTTLYGEAVRRAYRLCLPMDAPNVQLMSDAEALHSTVQRLTERWWERADSAGPLPCGPLGLGPDDQPAHEIIQQARDDLARRLTQIGAQHPLRPSCNPLGTGVPIVQGPMAHVSEGHALAQAVRASGAQPFIALSALDPEQARKVLEGSRHVPNVGAGVIAFDVAPHRNAHLALVQELIDGPVILAGASPQLARRMQAQGMQVWLHTPAPRLAGLAVSSGVRAVILEGHEAGGHVGPLPSSVLWEQGLLAVGQAVKAGRCETPLVVLAGGIGDAVSAAFAAALAAEACALGVRVALQAGTAFLFTEEIVAAGQITALCQELAVRANDTVLVGQTVNLPVRCIPNAGTSASRQQELRWAAQGLDLHDRRTRMESRSLGLTRLAAKGIERSSGAGGPRYLVSDGTRQRDHGAFSVGQGAQVTDTRTTVEELVRTMTTGARSLLHTRPDPWGPVVQVVAHPSQRAKRPGAVRAIASNNSVPIAIVGLGCVLPDAPDVPSFWRNQLAGADSVGQVPSDRWSVQRYHHHKAGSSGPAYSASRAAGAVRNLAFDGLRYRVPPTVQPTMDRAQRMALLASDEATLEAGFQAPDFDGSRAAVIFGNAMGGEWVKKLSLRVRFRDLLDMLVQDGVIEEDALADAERRLEHRLQEEVVPLQTDSMVGLLGNLVAGRVSSWLDWNGTNHTVDAACAASLMALADGVQALRSGRCDAAVCGGSDGDLSVETYVGFTRTLALSSQGSRPFSQAADGFVMGEGAAAFALVRLDDAIAQRMPVWAVIRGIGSSSDGRSSGLTAPAPDGQRLAIQRAWADAGLDPTSAAFIEAHGTGTELGDRVEAGVITEIFSGPQRLRGPWVGSAKSSLGHLKSAAGAAGLLRASLIVATGVVPPTLHAGKPIAQANGLRLPSAPVRLGSSHPVGGVSAFGFGGTNVHVVIEAPPADAERPALLASLRALAKPYLAESPQVWSADDAVSDGIIPSAHVHLFAACNLAGLAEHVRSRTFAKRDSTPAEWRLAVVCGHDDDVIDVLDWLDTHPTPGAWLGSRAVIDRGTSRAVLVVAPGQGAQRMGAVRSARRFAAARDTLDAVAGVFEAPIALKPGDTDTRSLHRHLVGVGVAWAAVLKAANVPVHAAVGHSLGELSALVAAGRVSSLDAATLAMARGRALHHTPTGAMLALALPEPAARALVVDAHLAAVNDASSTVWAGSEASITALQQRARTAGIKATRLSVNHGFHSPDMQGAADELRVAVSSIIWRTGTADWFSAAMADRSADAGEALVHALTAPVRWHNAWRAALPDNPLVVELGPGRTLTRRATALGVPAIALDPDPAGDRLGPCRAAMALWCAGHPGMLQATADVVIPQPTTRRPVGATAYVSPPEASRATPTPQIPTADPAPARDETPEQAVMAALQQTTGYAPDVLRAAVDLQAELGIDSIRRLEILGAIQERLDITFTEADELDLDQLDVEGLVALATKRKHSAKTAERSVSMQRAEWLEFTVRGQPVELADGWTSAGGRSVWRAQQISPERLDLAVQQALHGARQLPANAALVVAVVQDHAAGHAAAAAMACAAAERGLPFHQVRLRHGALPTIAAIDQAVQRDTIVRLAPGSAHALHWRGTLGAPGTELRTVVVTGGATGIALPCALRLNAQRVVVVGRRSPDDPQVAAVLNTTPEHVDYRVLDILSGLDTQRVLSDLTEVDLVLHGAGVLRDAPVQRLTETDVIDVLGPKVRAITHLQHALPNARIVGFSSVTAHRGNRGQLVYAAANAALEMLIPCIAWSAWSDVGMAASQSVQTALSTLGVQSLTTEQGLTAFDRLIALPATTVVTREPLAPVSLPWPINAINEHDSLRARLRLIPDDPALADHRVAGRCLVPAAVWLDAIATLLDRQPQALSVQGFEVLAPTFVDHARDDLYICISEAGEHAHIQVRANNTVVAQAHTRAAQRQRTHSPRSISGPPALRLYRDDLLFHGPTWRVLDAIEVVNGSIRARLASNATRAATVDAAHQLASIWMGYNRGHLGLPVAAEDWTWWEDGPAVHLELQLRTHDGHTVADLIATNSSGRAVLEAKQLRMAVAAPLSESARAVIEAHAHE